MPFKYVQVFNTCQTHEPINSYHVFGRKALEIPTGALKDFWKKGFIFSRNTKNTYQICSLARSEILEKDYTSLANKQQTLVILCGGLD